MLLLIDNYDSFAHNLARYFQRLGTEVQVLRNDALVPTDIEQLRPQAIVLSPGPCTPAEAGCSLEVVRAYHRTIPMLGVCLGHQAIAAALGASIVRAQVPMHGRTSLITHNGRGIFRQVPSPLEVCRYHSLVVQEETLPAELVSTAHASDGSLMAFAHCSLPLVGVQFHPEAILTQHGYRLLAGFLSEAGIEHRAHESLSASERREPPPTDEVARFARPVTF